MPNAAWISRAFAPFALLIVLAMASCGKGPSVSPATSTAAATNTTAPTLADWSFRPADAASVGDVFAADLYTIRPPADFRYIKEAEKPTLRIWAGPIRADETYPTFIIQAIQLPNPNPYPSMNAMMEDVLHGIETHRTNWSAGRIEHGIIGGREFVRVAWTGIADEKARAGLVGKHMHGKVYLTVDDGKVIQIMCEDAAADYETWLKRADVAVSTMHIIDPRP